MGVWLVTAPHLNSQSLSAWEPWCIRHARRSGDARTACGLPALAWHMFWQLPFEKDAPESCRECCASVFEGPASKGAVVRPDL